MLSVIPPKWTGTSPPAAILSLLSGRRDPPPAEFELCDGRFDCSRQGHVVGVHFVLVRVGGFSEVLLQILCVQQYLLAV